MCLLIFVVDVGWSTEAECLVGAGVVEHLSVLLGFGGQGLAVGDLEAVEVFVLQRPEGALAHSVLPRSVRSGADVGQLGP